MSHVMAAAGALTALVCQAGWAAVDCSHVDPATGIAQNNGYAPVADNTPLAQLPSGAFLKFQQDYSLGMGACPDWENDTPITVQFPPGGMVTSEDSYTFVKFSSGTKAGCIAETLIPGVGPLLTASKTIPQGSEAVLEAMQVPPDSSFPSISSPAVYEPGYSAPVGNLSVEFTLLLPPPGPNGASPAPILTVGNLISAMNHQVAVCAAQ